MDKYNVKKVAHYKLNIIKDMLKSGKYIITNTAITNARNDFNIRSTDIPSYICTLDNTHFYKSMTCDKNHKVWQDVYHLPIKNNNQIAYIKLQINLENESVIIQFKRK